MCGLAWHEVGDGEGDDAVEGVHAVEQVPATIKTVLAAHGWAAEDIDLVAPHQASETTTKHICQQTGVPRARCMLTGRHLGNTAASSVPAALSIAHQEGRLTPTTRTLLVGGVAGFSAATMVLGPGAC